MMTKMIRAARQRRVALALLGGVFVLGLLALPAGVLSRGNLLTVVQRETAMRKEKRLLSPKVATLREGDQVAKIGAEGSWYRVEFKGAEGWLPSSSVSSDRKVVLSGQAISSQVRATEQSAGARGFNPEVEARHRSSRLDLAEAYKTVDRIQARELGEEKIAQFIEEGKLGEPVLAVRGRPVPPGKR